LIGKAKGFFAFIAMKMLVIEPKFADFQAEGVFHTSGSIGYAVNQFSFFEDFEGSEQSTFTCFVKSDFQLVQ
jgi:hypothetical protein